MAGLLLLVVLGGLQGACQAGSDGTGGKVVAAAVVTPAATVTAAATAAPLPTPRTSASAPPSATLAPTAEPTATLPELPTPTSEPTASPAAVVLPTLVPDSVDRACPEPAPPRPEYRHYYLPARFWPEPGPVTEHFWLARPLPGQEPLQANEWYPYGYDADNRYLLHNGHDLNADLGTPLLAVAAGTVVVAGSDDRERYGWRCDWYGHLVVLQLDQAWQGQPVFVLYGHVLNITVAPGQRVAPGEQVAEVGLGGAAQAAHLHLEVRVGSNEFGATRNPRLWLDPGADRGVVAGRLVDPEGRPWQGVAVWLTPVDEAADGVITWTYLGDPQNLIHPDEGWAENFVFGDQAPGQYELYTRLQEVDYRATVEVEAGRVAAVGMVTEALKEE